MTPRVSVVMAVRNGEAHLREALDSILAQTLGAFELIVVDDASDDRTPEILASCAARDPRIRLLRNPENIGPYPSANRALEIARAPLIARMDGDDISAPERLERQVAFLDRHPDHLLVGCGYLSIDEAGRRRYARPNPLDDFAVRWIARFGTPMVHPGICFRATFPDGSPVRYPDRSFVAQDFALIAALLARGKAASLGDMLVHYRMHDRNISSNRREEQDSVALATVQEVMRAESGEALARAFLPLHETLYHKRPKAVSDIAATRRAFRELYRHRAGPADPRWMKRRGSGFFARAYLSEGPLAERLKWALLLVLRAPEIVPPLLMLVAESAGLARTDPSPDQD